MKKLNTYLLIPILVLTILIPQKSEGQEQPDLGNYMFFLPLINPAAAGGYSNLSGVVFGRKQWFSMEGAPARYGVQVIQPNSNYTFGGLLTQETIGVHSKQKLFGSYTYGVKLGIDNYLEFGMSGGAVLMEDKYSDVQTTESADNQFSGSKTILRPDFNFGIFYYNDNLNIGFAIPSLIHNTVISDNGDLKGKTNILLSYWQYYLHGGYNYKINSEYSLMTSALANVSLNAPLNLDLNVQLQYLDFLGGGISYRTKSEVVFFGNVKINDMFRICYCYHSYFNINGRYLMGHEIILTFNNSKSKPAVIQNPRF